VPEDTASGSQETRNGLEDPGMSAGGVGGSEFEKRLKQTMLPGNGRKGECRSLHTMEPSFYFCWNKPRFSGIGWCGSNRKGRTTYQEVNVTLTSNITKLEVA
jgi:hypothetical protein